MSKRGDKDFINDIEEAITRIKNYTLNQRYNEFLVNEMMQDAVIRNLEIIGEATKSLTVKFMSDHSNINWSDLAKTRDKLIHHYFGINIDIIWEIVINDLIPLLEDIGKLKSILER